MSSVRCAFIRCGALLFLGVLTGCGSDGPQILPVTGTLTYKGQAVNNAVLWFQPETGRPSWGQTDEQGQFKLSYDKTRDGAVAGKHKVWIDRRAVTQAERDAQMQGKELATTRDMSAFFKKYNQDNSTLTVEVSKANLPLKLDLD
jgi:hypothetical protein